MPRCKGPLCLPLARVYAGATLKQWTRGWKLGQKNPGVSGVPSWLSRYSPGRIFKLNILLIQQLCKLVVKRVWWSWLVWKPSDVPADRGSSVKEILCFKRDFVDIIVRLLRQRSSPSNAIFRVIDIPGLGWCRGVLRQPSSFWSLSTAAGKLCRISFYCFFFGIRFRSSW